MSLRVVGAGLGRTGTLSLKLALEQLLGAPCYHMMEVLAHQEHIPTWHAAARGEKVDWNRFLSGYAAAVDWPASAYWWEIAQAFPDALILLSVRDPDSWWESASQTIFKGMKMAAGPFPDWYAMLEAMFTRHFVWPPGDDAARAKAAFVRHNEDVAKRAPAGRLLTWTASDGWAPICRALGLPVPAEPFPRANSRDEFLARMTQAVAERPS